MTLVGGRISAVTAVPDDWFVEVQPPISGRSVLALSANHGASWLYTADSLHHVATITTDRPGTPQVSATVTVSTATGDRQVALRPCELRLEPQLRR
jgi:hypothetical protein